MALALIGVGLGVVQTANATVFDWTDDAYGNAPAVVSLSGSVATDETTFYLYNVAQKKFLNVGGWWGTECILSDIPQPVYFKKVNTNNSNYYIVLSPTSTRTEVGCVYNMSNDYQNGMFIDAGYSVENNYSYWNIASASGRTNQYTFSYRSSYTSTTSRGYLTVSSTRADVLTGTSSTDDNSYWKLISLKDVKSRFNDVQDVSYDSPVDATFYIQNPSMTRASVEAANIVWTVSGTDASWTTNKNTQEDLTYFLGNDLYYNTEKKVFTLQSDPDNTDIGSLDGDKYIVKDTDEDFITGSGVSVGDQKWYNLFYGQYFNARILGDGTVSQDITVDKAGWYELSCQGFNSEGNANAVIFAKVSGKTDAVSDRSNTIQQLPDGVTYNMTTAGYAFSQELYNNVVLVYVPTDNSTITIGVKVTGSTADGAYTEFDEFRLKYRGLPTTTIYPILLDENETSTVYTSFPKEASQSSTVVLKRTFTSTAGDQWNSIVLPFSLTGSQVKNYFGQNVKLAKLTTLTGSKIWFTTVDLAEAGLDAKVPYIIKLDPVLAQYSSEDETVQVAKAGSMSGETWTPGWSDEAGTTVQGPYFIIPQVVLDNPADPENNGQYILPEEQSTTASADNSSAVIQAVNLFVKKDVTLTADHHYFAFSKGNLVDYTTETRQTLPMKGFRVYFDWSAKEPADPTSKMSVVIDGVEDSTTDIESVLGEDAMLTPDTSRGVYSINGQQVRANGSSLEGLAKGIYVVNNRKYVVK